MRLPPADGGEPGDRLVLVADDDPAVRATFAAVLRAERFEVAVAPDGLVALELLRRRRFTVALLDHAMPGLNGLAVLRHLREAGAETSVVIISASMEPEDRAEAHRMGAVAVLPKPPDLAQLLRLCHDLGRSAPASRGGR